MKIKRANLFGAELTVTTYAELLQITDELIAKKPTEPYRYNFCNVHVVMMTLENPYNCPHGRPTLISMTKYELEKRFMRTMASTHQKKQSL